MSTRYGVRKANVQTNVPFPPRMTDFLRGFYSLAYIVERGSILNLYGWFSRKHAIFEFYVSIGLFISKRFLTQEGRGDSEGKGDGLQVVEESKVLQIKGLPVECIINMLSGSLGPSLRPVDRLKEIA